MPAEKAGPADEKLPPGAACPLWLPFTNNLDDMRGSANVCSDPVYLTCHSSFFSGALPYQLNEQSSLHSCNE